MFHRLIQAVRYCWDKFQEEDPSRFVKSSGKHVIFDLLLYYNICYNYTKVS